MQKRANQAGANQAGVNQAGVNQAGERAGRVGRPPAGAKAGERVKDYPQVSVRVPQELKARLTALGVVTGLAQWRLIVDAIACYVEDLPPTDRKLVDGLCARLLKSPS